MNRKKIAVISSIIGISALGIVATAAGITKATVEKQSEKGNGVVLVESEKKSTTVSEKLPFKSDQKVVLAKADETPPPTEETVSMQIGQVVEERSLSAYDVDNLDKRIDDTIAQKIAELNKTLEPKTETITIVETGKKVKREIEGHRDHRD